LRSYEKYSFILEEITAIVSEFEKVDFEERLINDLMSSSVSISVRALVIQKSILSS